jgi:hypothetical protein
MTLQYKYKGKDKPSIMPKHYFEIVYIGMEHITDCYRPYTGWRKNSLLHAATTLQII